MFNKDNILSNKIIMSHDGILYQVCRKRNGLLHSIELSYNMINGIKTIKKRVPFLLGWITQFCLETCIPYI